ncbi:von Willebrand factor type A domain-containing protein, partial [Desulfonatronum zhilinae]
QVNTAIHLLVDISGSMDGRRLAIAKEAVFALVKALAHQRGINLALTLFPAHYPYNQDISGRHDVYPVAPLLKHGQKPTGTMLWPLYARGCTPLAESLRYVLASMVPLTESRKLVVLLTDGEPNDFQSARIALEEARTLGVEVATLGIEGLYNTSLFPICEIVDRVEHLPQKAFKLLESLLTTNKE